MKQEFGTPFMATATHDTSAVATKSGAANTIAYITDISGSSDKDGALILVKDGTTIIWQDRVSNTMPFQKIFSTPLPITKAADCSVTVDGSAICNANIAGFTITTP